MDGYTMIAAGIGLGILVLILAVKVYDCFGRVGGCGAQNRCCRHAGIGK